jgi:hypothetical protein
MASRPKENLTLCVRRDGLDNLRKPPLLVKSPLPQELPSDHILVKIDKFGFSANNVTYGVLGDNEYFRSELFRARPDQELTAIARSSYFDFYPAPETPETSPKRHGIIPVWGFCTILSSSHPSIQPYQRLYGYLPMSRYALIPISKVNPHTLTITLGNFPPDRKVYKQLTICSSDPMYRQNREDETMLYRPLFWTSYWCADQLACEHFHGARRILISSASAKTAFCLAYVIKKKRETGGKMIDIVGFTSPGNIEFTKELGLYDYVFAYEDLTHIANDGVKTVYVDVAGNESLNHKIRDHIGSSLVVTVILGSTNTPSISSTTVPSSSLTSSAKKQSYKQQFFFTPEWLAHRQKQLSVHDIVEMQTEAWDHLMIDCRSWVKMESVDGGGVVQAFEETVKGKVGPDRGLTFSLWGDEEGLRAKM